MSLSDRVQVFSEKLGANVDVCIGYSESYFSETDMWKNGYWSDTPDEWDDNSWEDKW